MMDGEDHHKKIYDLFSSMELNIPNQI